MSIHFHEAPPKEWCAGFNMSYQATIVVDFKTLRILFGEPRHINSSRTYYEWYIQDESGNCVTVYDWKTSLTDVQLRTAGPIRWNVGGHSMDVTIKFAKWLQSRDETVKLVGSWTDELVRQSFEMGPLLINPIQDDLGNIIRWEISKGGALLQREPNRQAAIDFANEWLKSSGYKQKALDGSATACETAKQTSLIGRKALYYPWGKNNNSIKVKIVEYDADCHTYRIELTDEGGKDVEFMGYGFNVDDEWAELGDMNLLGD